MNIWLTGLALIAGLHPVAAQENIPAQCTAVKPDAMLVDAFSEPASIYYDFNTLHNELSTGRDETVAACAHSLASAILTSIEPGGDLEGVDALEVMLYSLTPATNTLRMGSLP